MQCTRASIHMPQHIQNYYYAISYKNHKINYVCDVQPNPIQQKAFSKMEPRFTFRNGITQELLNKELHDNVLQIKKKS